MSKFNRLLSVLIFFVSLFAFMCSPIMAQPAQTPEYNAFDKAEARLKKVYEQVLHDYAEDRLFIEKLKASQAAWEKYVFAYLDSRFPAKDKLTEYGSVYPLCCAMIRTELDESRTKQLQAWLDGAEEGDSCAGSIHRKH